MKVLINLFGGPGCGKSTTAAGLFSLLKIKGYKCELVTEYAKELVYDNRIEFLCNNQLAILSEQYSRIERVRDKVDIVITDSPILLNLIYAKTYYNDALFSLIKKLVSLDKKANLNIMVPRKNDYQKYGRTQTLNEALIIDEEIQKLYPYLVGEGWTSYPVLYIPQETAKVDYPYYIYNNIENHIKYFL